MSSAVQEAQLEPRYRRVLSFGDVLDESVGLFRRRWAFFALVSAVWLIPPGLLTVLVTAERRVRDRLAGRPDRNRRHARPVAASARWSLASS